MDRVTLIRVVAGIALASTGAPAALGAVGVGVGTTAVTAPAALQPGHEYRLHPDFYVTNTGDQTTTYSIRVERLSRDAGAAPAPGWISLGRTRLRLRPGEHARTAVFVRLPKRILPGVYATDLVASGSLAAGGSRTVSIGAAAATQVRFTIAGRRSGLAAAIGWPWSDQADALTVCVGMFLLAAGFWRRLGLRLVVERSGKPDR
jgi:hypothetical protein